MTKNCAHCVTLVSHPVIKYQRKPNERAMVAFLSAGVILPEDTPVRNNALRRVRQRLAHDAKRHVIAGRQVSRRHIGQLGEVEEHVRCPVARPDEAKAASPGSLASFSCFIWTAAWTHLRDSIA